LLFFCFLRTAKKGKEIQERFAFFAVFALLKESALEHVLSRWPCKESRRLGARPRACHIAWLRPERLRAIEVAEANLDVARAKS
jgi:hypothetical protein